MAQSQEDMIEEALKRNLIDRPEAMRRIAVLRGLTEEPVVEEQPTEIPQMVEGQAPLLDALNQPSPIEPSIADNFGQVAKNMASGASNQFLGAGQGSSPVVRDVEGNLNYEPAEDGFQQYFSEAGNITPQMAENMVVFFDPAEQKNRVFYRNEKMEEGGFMRGARLMSQGLVTQPPVSSGMKVATESQKIAQNITDVGGKPSIATSNAGKVTQQLSDIPIVGSPIRKEATKLLHTMQNKFNDIADKIGQARTVEDAGTALKKGSHAFVSRFKTKSSAMLSELDNFMAKDVVVPLTNTIEEMSKRTEFFEGYKNIQSAVMPPKIKGIIDDVVAKGSQLSWEQTRELRSWVGDKLTSSSIIEDIPTKDLKSLYKSLSNDMRSALGNQPIVVNSKGIGTQKALDIFNRHNKYFSAGADRINGALSKLLKEGTGEGKSLFSQVISPSKGGNSANLAQVRAIRRSITPEEWDDVAAVAFREMGSAKGQAGENLSSAFGTQAGETIVQFSPNTFINNWKQLSEGGREVLFGGEKYKGLGKELNALISLSNRADGLQKLAKPAPEMSTLANIALVSALWMRPVQTAALASIGTGASALLSYPKFLNLVNRLGRGPNPPKFILAKLNTFAEANPEVSDEVLEYIKAVEQNLQTLTQDEQGN